MVSKVLGNPSKPFGCDAQTETHGDLVEVGIVDPAKVVRTALQDATSVAGLLVTTEALVADRYPPRFIPPAMSHWLELS
ncbi:60 kDa chaperonin [Methylorubrum suomiense]|uniref:60 kDa chaperonin n=1 Tax=Methylorubrum suomiense TaxID=144191 RepID=A0ABQ4V1P6_9HYPH|nr:60 kDa chaperonin [Methylorubrum suomiense]